MENHLPRGFLLDTPAAFWQKALRRSQ